MTSGPAPRPDPEQDPLGQVLPEGGSGDDAVSWGETDESSDDSDERLRRDVPPHHGS